jgi:hypothetical protein
MVTATPMRNWKRASILLPHHRHRKDKNMRKPSPWKEGGGLLL